MFTFDCAVLESHMTTGQPSSKSDAREEKSLWTKREREIVEVVAQGYRVAQRFCISEQTVKNPMYNILCKLGIGTCLELRSVPAFIMRVEIRSSRFSVLSISSNRDIASSPSSTVSIPIRDSTLFALWTDQSQPSISGSRRDFVWQSLSRFECT